jgi:hypothetical protein
MNGGKFCYETIKHKIPSYLINTEIYVKNILGTKCVFEISTQLLFETFSACTRVHFQVKCPLLLLNCNKLRNVVTNFCKSPQYKISQKSRKTDTHGKSNRIILTVNIPSNHAYIINTETETTLVNQYILLFPCF